MKIVKTILPNIVGYGDQSIEINTFFLPKQDFVGDRHKADDSIAYRNKTFMVICPTTDDCIACRNKTFATCRSKTFMVICPTTDDSIACRKKTFAACRSKIFMVTVQEQTIPLLVVTRLLLLAVARLLW